MLLGAQPLADFVATHIPGQTEAARVEALTLLEAQRHAMAMYTSCGWFFHDLAGLETVQVLRYAARVMDLLAELDEDTGEDAFLAELAGAESNVPEEGDGRRIWRTHVEPARVDAGRVAAHLALLALLVGGDPPSQLAAHAVEPVDDEVSSRGAVGLASGARRAPARADREAHRPRLRCGAPRRPRGDRSGATGRHRPAGRS